MTTSPTDLESARASDVIARDGQLIVRLHDGRSLSVPLNWYPRLAGAEPHELAHWRLIGQGEGIHWPDLDEDVSVASLIQGRRSAESEASLRRWREARSRTR